MTDYDVIIVGGGPAGVSGALVLGRSCRRVLVCNGGNPRNSASLAMHGFISRDGYHPGEFLQLARAELAPYGVDWKETTVTRVSAKDGLFEVEMLDGETRTARKVLLATGVADRVPAIPGIEPLYGKSVHHCPYCDGWEHRGQPVAVYGKGASGLALSLRMRTWTADVVLCTNGPAQLKATDKERLMRHDVRIREECIAKLEGTNGQLEEIVFENGERLRRRALFFSTGNVQRSELPGQLGCQTTKNGAVKMDRKQHTNVAGIYVAGDSCYDSQYVIIAAAEGAKAAMAIDQAMEEEDRA